MNRRLITIIVIVLLALFLALILWRGYPIANNPISFYGRVVDQDGKPLEGVTVDTTVTALPVIQVLWGEDKTKKESRVTDKSGLFSVEGERGVSFSVRRFEKTGYRETGYYKQGHVRYEPHSPQRHIPNSNKPIEFMLIRNDLQKAEEVFSQQLLLNWNAGSTILDLGSEVGKLEFSAKRMGRNAADTTQQFEWELNMQATGFTLTKLPDKDGIIAPLEGYNPNSHVGFKLSEKAWSTEARISYAILTDNAVYGLIDLTVYGDGEDGGVSGRVTVYLNKSGERNLDHK